MTQADFQGLSSKEAEERLKKYGPNQIHKAKKLSFWGIAAHEVTEPMILLLLFVGVVYSIWGKLGDAVTIFVIILLLLLAEVLNEFRAKKAIDSLEKIAAPKTKVLRDGKVIEIESEMVVPGDLLVLTTGTKIAADAQVVQNVDIQVDESALTGESFPQNKNTSDMIFAGTVVVAGEGLAQVRFTGQKTRLGEIASTLKEIKFRRTPLQLAMRDLSGKLVYVAIFFSILVPVIGLARGQDLRTMILTGLSLAFATIPEELPIVITMVLGLGSLTLSKNKFLVKKINSAEVLGNATVIVTDKTGTITENKMSVASLLPCDGYSEADLLGFASATLTTFSSSPMDDAMAEKAQALKVGESAGQTASILRERAFGNGRKTKSVLRNTPAGYELSVSGAPEEVFDMCSDVQEDVRSKLTEETSKGRRVIAIAHRKVAPTQEKPDLASLENGLDLIGLISFEDPPRSGVKETIAKAAKAGIRTIIVTGDHPLTAAYIAKEVGIPSDKVVTGSELQSMDDATLQETVKRVSIFARTTPQDKYRIVQALQKNGEIVAATGDGINDALALKSADIGIAMGLRGTDVAREAAAVVLADDNYVTIAQGIFEGRKFFDNLQKGIKYYLTVKVALILIFLMPVLLGIPMPLAPIQIILLELFMDLAASAGFVAEPQERNIYTRPPRDPKEGVLGRRVVTDIFVNGAILFLGVIGVFLFALGQGMSLIYAQTFAFSAWIFGHIALAYVSRSDSDSVFSLGLFSNRVINIWAIAAIAFLIAGVYLPFLNVSLNLTAISITQFVLIAVVMVALVNLVEVKKLARVQAR